MLSLIDFNGANYVKEVFSLVEYFSGLNFWITSGGKPHFGHIPEARLRIVIKVVILVNRLMQQGFISSFCA